MVEQGFGLTITSVVYRPDIALIPLPSALAPTAAMISSRDNDNPALPLLLKCFDNLSRIRPGATDQSVLPGADVRLALAKPRSVAMNRCNIGTINRAGSRAD